MPFVGALLFIASRPAAVHAQGPPEGQVQVQREEKHDVSPPLRDLKSSGTGTRGPNIERPLRLIPHPGSALGQADGALQTRLGPQVAVTPGLNFAGVGQGDYGFSDTLAPPDTNGAVGATQYVQWVNASFAVFDKATGALVHGPVAGNTLWSGFGGGCETNNNGDPIAQYDKAANRWVMSQFSVKTTPFLQCVAVSTTSDATGTYNRYSFAQPNFNDYPKLGVWPDGYYVSFNMFDSSNTFLGGRACAFDRSAMLAGTAATQQCFQLSTSFGGLLPSDLDGSTAPPAGSPNLYVAFGNDNASLDIWKFHVDFAMPANSTFVHTNIPVPAFNPACSGGGTCIPQSGTSQQLDSLADRLMYRLAYRNFGDHESLVVNHSVTAGSSVGVRWYELRGTGGTPTVYQSGTYAPDSNYRWMGSIAMDKMGNIAVGYSVSSSSLHPAIRYTGRAVTDTLGTLQAENTIINGAGSQTKNLSRWGDYSGMTIDPGDDCTFFYTNEYLKANGSFNWSTQIASFKFPSCIASNPVADLTIAKTHQGNFVQGQLGASYTITVSNIGAGATSATVLVTDTLPVGLSATSLSGTGWSCTINPLACSRSDALAAASSYPALTLTVSVASNAPASVTNNVQVAGGGELNTANDTVGDPTTVVSATIHRFFLPLIQR